jgi:hypothetical protein
MVRVQEVNNELQTGDGIRSSRVISTLMVFCSKLNQKRHAYHWFPTPGTVCSSITCASLGSGSHARFLVTFLRADADIIEPVTVLVSPPGCYVPSICLFARGGPIANVNH